jgi:hypothetical protein
LILLAVTTDGRRECLERTIASAREQLHGLDGPHLIFDDSGDRDYQRWLRETYQRQGFTVAYGRERVGQGEALARMWKHLAGSEYRNHPWVFHLEDDFLFNRPVDLEQLREVLEEHPHLAQMALLRQPWFPGEVRAGGIIERDPDEYTQVSEGELKWLEHRMWFTLNPCLYRRELCELERPIGHSHEWHFSRRLCEDPDVRFGLWGDGTPWVTHIGEKRMGRGY